MSATITISGAEIRRKLDEGSALVIGVLLGSLVHPGFHGISALVGAGLMISGLTGFCGMALLLAKAPWNQRGDRQAVSV